MNLAVDLDLITLGSGRHSRPDEGMSVMEAVSVSAGEAFSDHPQCACPVLSAFMRSWNDALNDEARQRLKRYVPRLIGTNDGKSADRAWIFLDWMTREFTPEFLVAAGLEKEASSLRHLPEIRDAEGLASAQPGIDSARKASGAVVREHSGKNTPDRGYGDPWDCANAAFWAASGEAAWEAARTACKNALGDAVGHAAWGAVLAVAKTEDTSWSKLLPSVTHLQESIYALLERLP